jgi:hypothetical protein
MTFRFLLVPAALLAACGGPNPLEGSWTCPTGSDDWTNEMFVDELLEGTLTMHYTQGGTSYHSGMEHIAQDRGRGLYWIDVECVDDCPEAGKDFRMTCELAEDELSLDCEADGWYELLWERAE